MFQHAYLWKNISEWRKAIILKSLNAQHPQIVQLFLLLKKVNVKNVCKLHWSKNTEKQLHLGTWPKRSRQAYHEGDLLRKARECSRLPSRVQSKRPYHLLEPLHCEGPSIAGCLWVGPNAQASNNNYIINVPVLET